MSTQVCMEHGEDVVVFQSRYTMCPWCTEIADLNQSIEDITAKRDSLQSEIEDLKAGQ
jgi:cell division protein FtsL